jgi:hypothetical protein
MQLNPGSSAFQRSGIPVSSSPAAARGGAAVTEAPPAPHAPLSGASMLSSVALNTMNAAIHNEGAWRNRRSYCMQ